MFAYIYIAMDLTIISKLKSIVKTKNYEFYNI